MLSYIKNLLTAPRFPDDELTRTARTFHSLAMLMFTMLLMAVPLILIVAQQKLPSVSFILVGLVVNFLTMHLSHQRDKIRLAAAGYIPYFWLSVAAFVFLAGPTPNIASSLFIPAIIMAVLFLGLRPSIVTTLITLIYLFGLILFHNAGLARPWVFPLTELASWVVFMFSVLLTLIPVTIMHAQLSAALITTQEQLRRRQRAEEALAVSERQYRLFTELASDYAFSYLINEQQEVKIEWSNDDAYQRMTGFSRDEHPTVALDLFHPDDQPRLLKDWQELLDGQMDEHEYRIITQDGHTRWIQILRTPILDRETGRVVKVYGVAKDITDRVLAEQSLRESERRYRALATHLPDSAVFLFDRQLRLLLVEGPEIVRSGYVAEAMLGKTFREVFPTLADMAEPNMRAVFQGKYQAGEISLADQTYQYNYVPVKNSHDKTQLGMIVAQNITLRKQLEAELRTYTDKLEQLVEERTNALNRAKEQVELILNNTSDALLFADPSGDILVTNPAFHDSFEQPDIRSIEHIFESLADDKQAAVFSEAVRTVTHQGQPRRLVVQVTAPQVNHAKDLDLALIPIGSVSDEGHGLLLSGRDVTQQKEIERFKARFVSDALHDLATPITALNARIYLLERTPEQLPKHISALQNQVKHLQNLLEDLRILAKLDRAEITLDLHPHNLNEMVQQVFDTYEPAALENQQTLLLRLAPHMPELTLDQRQIIRVLVNLISNAISYTPANKTITIETLIIEPHIEVRITDQGIGISHENLPHIFERFYRAPEVRRLRKSGTGLGLAISKEIVELHGGSLSAVSELGVGSTFTVRLPLDQPHP